MKCARLHAARDIRLHEEPLPVPAEGEELVHVMAVGLCGSDRHWFVEGGIGDAVITSPLVLGHEIAGVVETGALRGQRVVLDPAVPCGACPLCGEGLGHLCADGRFAGHGVTDGGLRQYMAWPREQLVPVPMDMAPAEAAMLEPLAVAIHAVALGRLGTSMSAGVFGCGPIGLLLIRVLRTLGVQNILATEPLPARRAAAVEAGASDVRLPGEARLPEVDVAFEAAGEDAAIDEAVAAVRPAGRVVLVGIPPADRSSFRASTARRKGLTLLLTRRSRPADLRQAVQMAAAGPLGLGSLISARYSLDEAAAAFDDLSDRRGLKVIVQTPD